MRSRWPSRSKTRRRSRRSTSWLMTRCSQRLLKWTEWRILIGSSHMSIGTQLTGYRKKQSRFRIFNASMWTLSGSNLKSATASPSTSIKRKRAAKPPKRPKRQLSMLLSQVTQSIRVRTTRNPVMIMTRQVLLEQVTAVWHFKIFWNFRFQRASWRMACSSFGSKKNTSQPS